MIKTNGANFREDIGENNDTKKKGKGRRRFRSISRTGMTVRLFNGSKMYIEKMVKELRFTDPNFATEAAAVRHYVNIGIAAETATSDLRNSLDNTIIKRSITDSVRSELKSHSNHIENLINAFKEFTAENSQISNEIARRTEAIEGRVENGFESVAVGFDSILNLLKDSLSVSEESLRNIIVLRTVTYVLLLGHKTGKIEPGRENLVKWQNIINLAHEKANHLSLREVEMLGADTFETTVIQGMASAIFREIRSLPEPQME